MSVIQSKNRLRQKVVVRVANKPWKTLKLVFYFGILLGAGLGFALFFILRGTF